MDISRVFTNKSESVANFFQQPGIGYYIPMYQREYSWDSENIDQLIEDICSGVVDIVDGSNEQIHFMGTLILVTETKPIENIRPIDQRALPSRIDNVIDGQQRISTIALLACQLYQKLYQSKQNLPTDEEFSGLSEAIDTYLTTLQELFSVDLLRGNPKRKPIIIRASVDQWTLDGEDDNYKSDIASYLSRFIRAIHSNSSFPKPSTSSLVGKNIKKIDSLLKKVEKAHESSELNFPLAWDILERFKQTDLWNYERPELVQKFQDQSTRMSTEGRKFCTLVQLFAFCHYLLQRCCFTIIQPISDVRAFDMFQSLNATGTPLTAFETFRPLVVNYVESTGNRYKDSKSEKYLELVDQLLSSPRSAQAKNKLTDEFLTLFSLANDGLKLSKQFSAQRRWLNSSYEIAVDKDEFISRMGKMATYWSKVVDFNPVSHSVISGIQNLDESEKLLATLCILFLQKANHKMANSILSRFYSTVIENVQGSDLEFARACKIIVAFFILWRSAFSNSGLDEVYRKLLREHLSWQRGNQCLSSQFLANHLRQILTDKGIRTKNEWVEKAKDYLSYDESNVVCRFVLFLVAEDTIPDPQDPGLMKIGTPGCTPPYLTPQRWTSDELGTVEHIAPQNPECHSSWDPELYQNESYQRIGNLTLLPVEINSSLSNKGWCEKYIYYQHLSETDPTKLENLASQAQAQGINLNSDAIALLKKTSTKHHILPIIQIGATGNWNKDLVDRRSKRICEITWDRLSDWLNPQ